MKHIPSGITIEISVKFEEEIRKYSPGVILISSEGMKTNRMTTDSKMYNDEDEAKEASFQIGKRILKKHLQGEEILYFDQQ